MYDIFFISFDEPNADENWNNLKIRFPRANRVHGIKGINNAHAVCASQSLTKMFWTVDADTVVDSDFAFDYAVMPWDEKYLHVWYSRNPVNSLEYGYGSIKLWPCAVAKKKPNNWLDFTTTVGKIKIIDRTVSTTNFNTDPFNAWKSGFREAVKLTAAILNSADQDAVDRLCGWVRSNTALYATETVTGAAQGIDFVLKHKHSGQPLQLINDFDWLKQEFANNYSNSILDLIDNLIKELGIKNV